MKICHLTSVHSYYDIRIFIKECRSLFNNGFEVHLIAAGAPSKISEGIFIHGVEKEENSRFKRMTKTTSDIYRKAIEINADVYHFHDPELLPVGLKLKKYGKKVIYDIHEDLPRSILSKYWINPYIRKVTSVSFGLFENYAAKQFNCLLTATPYITERFKKVNPATVNINNYPLLEELKTSFEEKDKKKTKSVCYVGGIGAIRGAHQVLEASKYVNGKIEFAGPISSDDIKTKIESLDNVEYLGTLDREEVRDLLARSMGGLVTFLPEPNHVNAQPNKMFEYMSAGVPVIGSNFPLWKNIIEKKQCGICVDPEDPKAIAEAINYLIDHPEDAEAMGKNGRHAVETEFNWEAESKKLIAVYESLMK